MSWIPKDASVVALIVSLTAILGTVVNAVAGLSQFSRTAKAYRTIEWTNSTLDQDQDDEAKDLPRGSSSCRSLRALVEVHGASSLDDPGWVSLPIRYWGWKIFV